MNNPPDPWAKLVRREQSTQFPSLRVDPNIEWDLYWAIDPAESCLLVLQHQSENRPTSKLPNWQGLEVLLNTLEGGGNALIIRLKDGKQREIFHHLCRNIIEATRAAKTEAGAVEVFLSRTWRWHWLLQGGRDERLSESGQIGLIGELRFLHQYLIPAIGAVASVNAWTGPFHHQRDFRIGGVYIEVKTRGRDTAAKITISSEHQLDTNGLDRLFLSVLEANSTIGDDPDGITVTDLSEMVLEAIRKEDMSVVDEFENRLMAAGFNWEHDYSDSKWLLGAHSLYEVVDEFPRITSEMCRTGVSNVKYLIAPSECEPFRVDFGDIVPLLGGSKNGQPH